MDIPTYEIYAVKFAGPLIRPAALVHWFQDLEKSAQVNYYIFALRGGGETILVDAGMDPQLGKERNLTGFVNPAEALKRIDIDAENVKHVVITHIHIDHIGGIKLFPKANIYVQEKEFNFWIKNPIAQRAPFLQTTDPAANRYVGSLEGRKRLHLIRGDKKILPGIQVLLAPGHTPGHQAVAVNTLQGTAIVGSDLAHVFSSYRTDFPSAIIADMAAWMKSYDKVRAKVSSLNLLFPGHDPALLDNYPKVAEDVSKLV